MSEYMYIDVCVVCVSLYVYIECMYVCGCTRVCMHVWRACMGTCVSVLCVCADFPSSLCICLRVIMFRIRS